jgi:hypothetical protein
MKLLIPGVSRRWCRPNNQYTRKDGEKAELFPLQRVGGWCELAEGRAV